VFRDVDATEHRVIMALRLQCSHFYPACAALALLWLTGLQPAGAEAIPEAPLILTQVPRQNAPASGTTGTVDLTRRGWFAGARLVLVSPGGDLRTLSDGLESACDPNLSFDGQRVLFAGRKTREARWRIWEMTIEGLGLRAVSPDGLDAWSPIHASTLFTLDSPQPWFTAVFVGADPTLSEGGREDGSSLYNLKLDGTELRRMTFNPNVHLDPFQMWDGRVIYSAEHVPQEPGGAPNRTGLYAIHLEGADMERYGGGRGGRVQVMPCATERGLVVFVETDGPTRDGGGQLACVEERRPHVTYRRLTQDPANVFAYPTPTAGNTVLVARRSSGADGDWGIVSLDLDGGRLETVFDRPNYHEVQVALVRARPRPDGHSTVVNLTSSTGTFYGLNCYTADASREAHVAPGSVKRVRFIEGVLRAADGLPSRPARWPFIPRRLIGEAPVEADGSFNVEVPADTPLLLQTLDERGLALGTCGWIWVKPKETRGCIGCHEDPERIPENEYVLALRRPSNRLILSAPQRRAVAFRDEIVPLLRRHCASADCHGAADAALRLPLTAPSLSEAELDEAYAALIAPAVRPPDHASAGPWAGRYVDAGRARTSWLIWQILGENTSRPWDEPTTDTGTKPRAVRLMPPPGKGTPLRAEDVRTFIQWIDLGAQFEAVQLTETAVAQGQAP